jgi:phage-related protein
MKIVLLKEAQRFMENTPEKARLKVYYNLRLVQSGVKDIRLFKKLEGSEIWEFRTNYGSTAYRLFAFWDTRADTLVVATHGIMKKTQKTPVKEIAKAEQIRMEYFKNK